MGDSLRILLIVVTFATVKADDSHKTSRGPRELFCADDATLFYISPDKDVTSPPTKTRLRILRLQDGKLLLDMEGQLVYPIVPNITPVFLSEEDKLIMLPDLEKKGAAVGLQLPEGLHVLVHQLLHRPPPPEDVTQVLSRAESIAAGLLHKAEAMGGAITEKAASFQVGAPAGPSSHPRWRAGAHYARKATEKMVDVTARASNLVGKAIETVGQTVRPSPPNMNKSQTNEVKTVGNPYKKNSNKPVKYLGRKMSDNMATATIKAVGKIREALIKAAQILATSLKENTVKVVEHKFGADIVEAGGDVVQSVKNAVAATRHIDSLKVENIAQRAARRIIGGTAPGPAAGKPPQGSCKPDL